MVSSFTVFGVTLYPYALCIIAGAVLCFLLLFFRTLRRHRESFSENLYAMSVFVVSAAIALPASMVADALFKMPERGVFRLEGSTFYGGPICALIVYPVALLFRRTREVSIYERMCDLAACIPAGHCLGRIGCFLGGCCFGKPTDCIFGVVFPEGSLAYTYYGGPIAVHPTQLYEAALLACLFFVLFFAGNGFEFPGYLIGYGIGRFAIEFFRNDDRGIIFGGVLSPAQLVSCILIAAGGILLAWQLLHSARMRKRYLNE